jgi:hypothetical protein
MRRSEQIKPYTPHQNPTLYMIQILQYVVWKLTTILHISISQKTETFTSARLNLKPHKYESATLPEHSEFEFGRNSSGTIVYGTLIHPDQA